MFNNSRVEPAPPIYPSLPHSPAFVRKDHPLPEYQPSAPSVSVLQSQPGMLNVPPMLYSVPVAGQGQPQPLFTQPVPTAVLKPISQPPPAPSLNEVNLSEERQRVRCPYCQASIVTVIKYHSGTMTHIAALAVLLVCCPLAWLPYTIEMCKDVDHSCSNCGRAIGKFKRFT